MFDFITPVQNIGSTQAERSQVSNEVALDLLLMEAIEKVASYELRPEAKAVSANAHKIAGKCTNAVHDYDSFNDWLSTLVREYYDRHQSIGQLDADSQPQAYANSTARFSGVCLFLNRVMGSMSRSAYYHKIRAEQERDGEHFSKADYNGLTQVQLTPEQPEYASNVFFEEVVCPSMQSIVNGSLVDSWNAETFCTPRIGSVEVSGQYVDFVDLDDMFKAIERNLLVTRVSAEATA
jgi:hypothetical protein